MRLNREKGSLKGVVLFLVLILVCAAFAVGQKNRKPRSRVGSSPPKSKVLKPDPNLPKVEMIDAVKLKALLTPNGRPLLVNFWATWCDPCREEFPELVEFNHQFKERIDFITVSLDDPSDISTTVPRFLSTMKAEMPAYLLKTADESAVISSISKDWQGGMPFTVLYSKDGSLTYFRQGKVVPAKLREEVLKLLPASQIPSNPTN